ncbi:YT521-B-like domain-containing protein [Stachybotrys elegans]|uniref:YT521-B-like domain-containing protein n=1 Tax=Stachybotrys elegans TaxID=80388 RepID=A0A8K0WPH1_9HYPO|nr:YT521-B-like domain-containing protein [Stachybotrys elegans]
MDPQTPSKSSTPKKSTDNENHCREHKPISMANKMVTTNIEGDPDASNPRLTLQQTSGQGELGANNQQNMAAPAEQKQSVETDANVGTPFVIESPDIYEAAIAALDSKDYQPSAPGPVSPKKETKPAQRDVAVLPARAPSDAVKFSQKPSPKQYRNKRLAMTPSERRPPPRKPTLNDLMKEDKDLRDWLEHTRFFDTEYRRNVLDKTRKLEVINKERAKLISEIQGSPMMFQRETGSVDLICSPGSPFNAPASSEISDRRKRLASPGLDGHHHKAPRRDGPPWYRDEIPDLFQDRARSRSQSQIRGYHHEGSRYERSLSPFRGRSPPQYRESKAYKHSIGLGFDYHMSGGPRVPRVPRGPRGPNVRPRPPLELTSSENIRFFLMKSNSMDHVVFSKSHGIWSTTDCHNTLLRDIFESSTRVILFFSVNRSKSFQGYARMASPPESAMKKPEWMQSAKYHHKGDAFRIDWINKKSTHFSRVHHITNPLAENKPVYIGFNLQEYPAECGHEMMRVMDE